MGNKSHKIEENKEPVISNFISDAYSDPTMLSFDFKLNEHSIMFCEEDVISPGSLDFWDDTSLLVDFYEGVGEVIATPHILLKYLNETSAYGISENGGQTNLRDILWMKFVQGFKYICKYQQWRIQAIEGLDTVFANITNYKDGYQGSGDDKITLTFLEDVELTMYHLFEFYRNAIYDQLYKRQLVPNNLLKFDCVIEISDRRRIKSGKITQETETLELPGAPSTYDPISPLNRLSDTYEHTYTYNKYSETSFLKPKISIILCDCIFDLSSLGKSFENIDPGDSDNTFTKYSISFKYGKALMRSNFIEEMGQWEKFKKEQGSNNKNSETSAKFYENNSKKQAKSIGEAIKGGFDGALNSAKQSGKDYLDNLVSDAEHKFDQMKDAVLGKEQGYELGDNIYGGNFISAFGKKLGDKLTGLADEAVNKIKSETVGKLNGLVSQGKAIVGGALATAESSLISGSQKGAAPAPNTLKSPQRSEATNNNPTVEKLSGNEKVYEEGPKSSSKFESFNVYENVPSGPKQ